MCPDCYIRVACSGEGSLNDGGSGNGLFLSVYVPGEHQVLSVQIICGKEKRIIREYMLAKFNVDASFQIKMRNKMILIPNFCGSFVILRDAQ